jgi:hypothetical protein
MANNVLTRKPANDPIIKECSDKKEVDTAANKFASQLRADVDRFFDYHDSNISSSEGVFALANALGADFYMLAAMHNHGGV